MGEVRTEVTLVNIGDAIKARDGFIPESEVRRITVNAVLDTGVWTLVINEEIRARRMSFGARTRWKAWI